MLDLADFVHLPEVDTLVARLITDGPGLYVVAGMDPHPLSAPSGFLPSGRGTLFRIVMRMMLDSDPEASCVVITADKQAVRVPRDARSRTTVMQVHPPYTYASLLASAVQRKPGLIVLDRLDQENAHAALTAAHAGVRVLSQLDTVFAGNAVGQHLQDLGAEAEHLAALRWVLAVQRLPLLCPHCKQSLTLTPALCDRLYAQGLISQTDAVTGTFFEAGHCDRCAHSGRHGDVMVLDICRAPLSASMPDPSDVLSAKTYVWRLVQRGDLALADVEHFEAQQLHRTYNLLAAGERALSESNQMLESKLAELETAHAVMEQRTRAVISLQDISQSLITTTGLDDLARQVCRYACELCGADRALVYLLRSDDIAEILAQSGWGSTVVHTQISADQVCDPERSGEPGPFNEWPPGVPEARQQAERFLLRTGLRMPLVAQGEPVGVMVIHSTRRRRFGPGEVALLQALANQAALAIQRASLIEDLRAKIEQLEAAQAGLAQKERMEHELALARQVQQSVLPRTFPQIPGYQFAAHNEPAREVGGDFYDVIVLDEARFGMAIADVSGKGMPAALYMALTRSLLLAESRRESSPAAVLATVNDLLIELGEPNMFVTVFYGVVDCAARRITFARAGHDRPILLRDGAACELSGKGAALGLFATDRLVLDELTYDLRIGDCLVLYTDGMTDVVDSGERLLTREQFIAMLCDHAGLSPDALCHAVFDDLAAYRQNAAQYDDMTMLVLAIE